MVLEIFIKFVILGRRFSSNRCNVPTTCRCPTVWPDGCIICSKYSHSQQWKFAPYHNREFAIVVPKFCQKGQSLKISPNFVDFYFVTKKMDCSLTIGVVSQDVCTWDWWHTIFASLQQVNPQICTIKISHGWTWRSRKWHNLQFCVR